MLRWKALVTLVVLGGLCAGCGSGAGGSGPRVRVPALPSDVPLPEAGVLKTALDLGAKGLNLAFETEEAPLAAAGRLRSRLETAGWVLLSEIALEKADFASYRKGGRSVAVGVSRSGNLSLISIAYMAGLDAGREDDRE